MKSHSKRSHGNAFGKLLSACLLAYLLLLGGAHCFAADPQPQVTWYAAPYPQSPQYLEVLVDTRTLPGRSYLSDVKFSVDCREHSVGPLRTSILTFTDTTGQGRMYVADRLLSGQIYRRYIKLPFPQGKFIKAKQLQYLVGFEGGDPVRVTTAFRHRSPHAGQGAISLDPAITQAEEQAEAREKQQLIARFLPPQRVKRKTKIIKNKQMLFPVRILTIGQDHLISSH